MKRAMRWLGWGLAGVAGVVAILLVVGWSRPPEVTAKAGVEINRPAGEVWEFLSKMENLPRWSAEVEEVVKISEQPLKYRVGGMGGFSETEYLVLEPPRRFVTKMAMPAMGFSGVWDIRVEPLGSGARVTTEAKLRISNPLMRAIGAFMNADAAEQATLEDLKNYLEGARR
jgi:uncharacterized protein YndB with AHSA1/START domain